MAFTALTECAIHPASLALTADLCAATHCRRARARQGTLRSSPLTRPALDGRLTASGRGASPEEVRPPEGRTQGWTWVAEAASPVGDRTGPASPVWLRINDLQPDCRRPGARSPATPGCLLRAGKALGKSLAPAPPRGRRVAAILCVAVEHRNAVPAVALCSMRAAGQIESLRRTPRVPTHPGAPSRAGRVRASVARAFCAAGRLDATEHEGTTPALGAKFLGRSQSYWPPPPPVKAV